MALQRVALTLLLLAGCSNKLSPEERSKQSNAELAKHKDALQAKVTAIEALSRVELPAPEEKITSPGVKLFHPSVAKDTHGKNVAFIPVEHLADLSAKDSSKHVLFMDVEAEGPPRWIKGLEKVDDIHPNATRSHIEAFEGLQYVLVLKQTKHATASLITDATGKKVFSPGFFSGEAHLLGVDGKRYGAVSFKATHSTSVTTHTKNEDQAWLDGNLMDNVYRAMIAAVKQQLPDAELE